MDRLSHSLMSIKEFRRMIEERDGITNAALPTPEPPKEVLHTKEVLENLDTPVDDGMPKFERDWDNSNMTVMDEVWAEFDLVKRAYIHVLKSWVELPGKL
jgi:hypothetical protein